MYILKSTYINSSTRYLNIFSRSFPRADILTLSQFLRLCHGFDDVGANFKFRAKGDRRGLRDQHFHDIPQLVPRRDDFPLILGRLHLLRSFPPPQSISSTSSPGVRRSLFPDDSISYQSPQWPGLMLVIQCSSSYLSN